MYGITISACFQGKKYVKQKHNKRDLETILKEKQNGHNTVKVPEITKAEDISVIEMPDGNRQFFIKGNLAQAKDIKLLDLSKDHVTLVDRDIHEFYQEIFGPAVKEYNQKQIEKGHPERQTTVEEYFKKCNEGGKAGKTQLCREAIFGIGNSKHLSLDRKSTERILKDFMEDWNVRNPNMKCFGCYMHFDEAGCGHVHVDFVPVCSNNKQGIELQNKYRGACEEMGFRNSKKLGFATTQWQNSERDFLEQCVNKELERLSKEGQKITLVKNKLEPDRTETFQVDPSEVKVVHPIRDKQKGSQVKAMSNEELKLQDMIRESHEKALKADRRRKKAEEERDKVENELNTATSNLNETKRLHQQENQKISNLKKDINDLEVEKHEKQKEIDNGLKSYEADARKKIDYRISDENNPNSYINGKRYMMSTKVELEENKKRKEADAEIEAYKNKYIQRIEKAIKPFKDKLEQLANNMQSNCLAWLTSDGDAYYHESDDLDKLINNHYTLMQDNEVVHDELYDAAKKGWEVLYDVGEDLKNNDLDNPSDVEKNMINDEMER